MLEEGGIQDAVCQQPAPDYSGPIFLHTPCLVHQARQNSKTLTGVHWHRMTRNNAIRAIDHEAAKGGVQCVTRTRKRTRTATHDCNAQAGLVARTRHDMSIMVEHTHTHLLPKQSLLWFYMRYLVTTAVLRAILTVIWRICAWCQCVLRVLQQTRNLCA